MGIVAKLRDVRMIYPHIGVPDRWGTYSIGVLIEKGSAAHNLLLQCLREAWADGSDRLGKALFEPNPTNARLYRSAYIKDGDGEDSKGRPLPEWMRGHLCFGIKSKDPCPIVDGNFDPVSGNDPDLVYNGQRCHVSLDIVAFNNAESHNSGLSRYLRSVVVLGGGERIVTQPGAFTDIVEEWS